MSRPALVAGALAGAALVVAPFLAWFEADGPGGTVRITGVEATGGLWSLPVLGLVVIAVAALAVTGRIAHGPAPGAAIAVAGGVALAWAVGVVLWPPVRLVADVDGRERGLATELTQLPATVVATSAASLAVLAGLVAWRAARPGDR